MNTIDELSDVRWLIGHANTLLGDGGLPTSPLRLAEHFRKHHSADRSRLLCELFELRRRGRSKFALADKMFFTRLGYEQATSDVIAAYKSERFPDDRTIVDLCCGVGGDAIALGRSRILTVVDRSPSTVALALANLRAHGVDNANGVVADVRSVDLSSFDFWHVDPDRRLGQRKHHATNACEPPLDEFLQLRGLARDGAIKLSPAADATELLSDNVELEWIGNNRECQQLVAWFGALARHPGKRTATCLLPGQEAPAVTLVEDGYAEIPVVTNTPRFVYEPRPSVLAAGLESSLAQQFGLHRLALGVPYLASEQAIESGLFCRFETLEILPYRRKTLTRKITEFGLHVTEVKKRGVNISTDDLLRKLSSQSGGEPAVVILFPIGQSIRALLARRCD